MPSHWPRLIPPSNTVRNIIHISTLANLPLPRTSASPLNCSHSGPNLRTSDRSVALRGANLQQFLPHLDIVWTPPRERLWLASERWVIGGGRKHWPTTTFPNPRDVGTVLLGWLWMLEFILYLLKVPLKWNPLLWYGRRLKDFQFKCKALKCSNYNFFVRPGADSAGSRTQEGAVSDPLPRRDQNSW